MGYENSAGLGVNNFYGPRDTGATKGFEPSDGVERKVVWIFSADTLVSPIVVPTGAVVTGVTKPTNITAVTVGGVAVQAATEVAPVKTAGAIAVTGGVAGNVVIVKYLHTANSIVVA